MGMPDKAPSLSGVVLSIPKGKGSDDSENDERDAFDAFAEAAGIPDDKKDDAYSALAAMIEACVARRGEYEKE